MLSIGAPVTFNADDCCLGCASLDVVFTLTNTTVDALCADVTHDIDIEYVCDGVTVDAGAIQVVHDCATVECNAFTLNVPEGGCNVDYTVGNDASCTCAECTDLPCTCGTSQLFACIDGVVDEIGPAGPGATFDISGCCPTACVLTPNELLLSSNLVSVNVDCSTYNVLVSPIWRCGTIFLNLGTHLLTFDCNVAPTTQTIVVTIPGVTGPCDLNVVIGNNTIMCDCDGEVIDPCNNGCEVILPTLGPFGGGPNPFLEHRRGFIRSEYW